MLQQLACVLPVEARECRLWLSIQSALQVIPAGLCVVKQRGLQLARGQRTATARAITFCCRPGMQEATRAAHDHVLSGGPVYTPQKVAGLSSDDPQTRTSACADAR